MFTSVLTMLSWSAPCETYTRFGPFALWNRACAIDGGVKRSESPTAMKTGTCIESIFDKIIKPVVRE